MTRRYRFPTMQSAPNSSFVDTMADAAIAPSAALELEAATWWVPFSDAANRQVVLNVSGNGHFPADLLSTGSDAVVVDARPVTVTDGGTAEIPGVSAQLVTFTGTIGTLKLDDALAFTGQISGLTGSDALDLADMRYGANTTASFAGNTSGGTLTVTNGTETANIALLGNYLKSGWTLSSDGHGGTMVVDPPLNSTDGSANAAAGTPQLPNLLSGYSVRPSWNVAGVDYNVGVSAGTVLKNPATISMAGVSVNSTNHTVTITGNNVTLSGYDFSLNGGWQVYVAGNNDTIENCNFAVGSNGQTPISVGVNGSTASNTTIEYNTINGNQASNGIGFGLIECNGIGTTTIEYNSITNAYSENMVIGNNTSSAANYVIQYNLIENAGYGFAAGAHGDWIQQYNAPGDVINSLQINYNTFVQTVAPGGGGTQGLSLQSANITQGPV